MSSSSNTAAEETLLTPELLANIGRQDAPRRELVTRREIRKYAIATAAGFGGGGCIGLVGWGGAQVLIPTLTHAQLGGLSQLTRLLLGNNNFEGTGTIAAHSQQDAPPSSLSGLFCEWPQVRCRRRLACCRSCRRSSSPPISAPVRALRRCPVSVLLGILFPESK